jgi:outer membrane lipoprotein-sorting protein
MSAPSRIAMLVLVLVLAVATPKPTVAADAAPSLAARAARFPALRTATADFTQEREVSLVDEVLRARGTIALAAPASFRLDVAEPMTLVTAGTTTTVVDAAGKATPIPAEFAGFAAFARTLTDLLLGNRAPEGFREAWRGTDSVVLTPTSDGASPFVEITLAFAADGPLPETITLRERGGDRTVIRLARVALNPTIDPVRFQSPVAKGS